MYYNPDLFKELNLTFLRTYVISWVKTYRSIRSITLHHSFSDEIYKERYILVWEIDGIDEKQLVNRPGYAIYKRMISDCEIHKDVNRFFNDLESLYAQFKGLKKDIDSYKQLRSLEFAVHAYSTKEIFGKNFIEAYKDGSAPITFRDDWRISIRDKGEEFPEGVIADDCVQLYPFDYIELYKGDHYEKRKQRELKELKSEIKGAYSLAKKFYLALMQNATESISMDMCVRSQKEISQILDTYDFQPIKLDHFKSNLGSKNPFNVRCGNHKSDFIRALVKLIIEDKGFFFQRKDFDSIYKSVIRRVKK